MNRRIIFLIPNFSHKNFFCKRSARIFQEKMQKFNQNKLIFEIHATLSFLNERVAIGIENQVVARTLVSSPIP